MVRIAGDIYQARSIGKRAAILGQFTVLGVISLVVAVMVRKKKKMH